MKVIAAASVLIGSILFLAVYMAPRDEWRYTNRTLGHKKIVKRIWGVPYKVSYQESNFSQWARQHTTNATEEALVWIPVSRNRIFWDGRVKEWSYEGQEWSLMASQIVGASPMHGEANALKLLRMWQDTNQSYSAIQQAYWKCFVASRNSIVYTTTDAGAPVARANPSYLEWTSEDQRKWAMGTCAILTEMNGGSHDVLGGEVISEDARERWQRTLEKWWGVRSKEDLQASLDWLVVEGHRADFEKVGAYVQGLDDRQFAKLKEEAKGDLEALNKLEIAREYYGKLGKKGLKGWDYSRYVSLCGWGVVAGYLTESEAWEKIMPVAGLLQSTFSSWNELGENFLAGRRYWSYRHSVRTGLEAQDAYKNLCSDSRSPWVRLPWGLPLPKPR